MTRMIEPYNARSLEPGDVMVRTVAVHVLPGRQDGELLYRVYVCAWSDPPLSDGVPQGTRIYDEGGKVAQQLCPIIGYVGAKPDLG